MSRADEIQKARDAVVEAAMATYREDLSNRISRDRFTENGCRWWDACERLDALTKPPTAREVIEAVRECWDNFSPTTPSHVMDDLLDDLESRLGDER